MEEVRSSEFFQNTLQILRTAAKVVKADPNILVRLESPRRVISVAIPVRMDDYSVKVFDGYRVQHCSTLGPFKGGIRYHQSVNVSEVASLATLMTFKNSLLNLPLGGAKGGVRVDPTQLSKTENQNLTRRFTSEISPFIGPTKDIPAPDVGTDEQTMAWMMDTFSQENGYVQPGVVTGKPIEIGGSLGRASSTGKGVVYIADEALKRKGKKTQGASFAIQGFGKVGLHAAITAHEMGAKIVAISDVSGAFFNPEGLNIEDAQNYIKEHRSLKGYSNAQEISNEELLELDVDVLCPCALDGVITEKNQANIKASVIVEGANGPVNADASEEMYKRGIMVVPDILANGGGVVVSYFEWVQGLAAYFWDEEQVNQRLRDVMTKAFETTWSFSQKNETSMRTAAMGVAIQRLEKAMLLRGLYPR